MFSFSIDYFLFVFVSGIGVIQVAASVGDLDGLLLVKSKAATRALGVALPVAAAIWFFSSETRNINDYEGGLDANVQALYFSFGALAATATSLILSSLVNVRMKGENAAPDAGLESLKSASYGRAVAHSLRYRWKEWRT